MPTPPVQAFLPAQPQAAAETPAAIAAPEAIASPQAAGGLPAEAGAAAPAESSSDEAQQARLGQRFDGSAPADPAAAAISRDADGVPTITAADDKGLYESLGYAHAQDRLGQMELARRASRGTLAEIFGEKLLPGDVFARTRGYTQDELSRMVAQLKPEVRAAFEAYRDGVNRYRAEMLADASKKPLEVGYLEKVGTTFAPWTVEDSLAVNINAGRGFGVYVAAGNELDNLALLQQLQGKYGEKEGRRIFDDVRWIDDPEAPTIIPSQPGKATRAPRIRRRFAAPDVREVARTLAQTNQKVAAAWQELGVPHRFGSFGWAVSAKKSATGKALFVAGPQVGIATPDLGYAARLHSPDARVFAFTIAGMPSIVMGKNDHVAFGLTSGFAPIASTYVEKLDRRDPRRYLYKGKYRDVETRTETFRVLGKAPVSMEIARTVHGPVIASDPARGAAYSLKMTGWMREHEEISAEFGALFRVKSIADLDRHFMNKPSYLSFNATGADSQGHIGYWGLGARPILPPTHDPRLPLSGTGGDEWLPGRKPLPRALDPDQGFLGNWNTKPEDGFINPQAFMNLPGLGGEMYAWGKADRGDVLFDHLRQSRAFTLDDMRSIVVDISRTERYGDVSRYLRPLIVGALAAATDPELIALRALIQGWDGTIVADAVQSVHQQPAATLYQEWYDLAIKRALGDELGPRLAVFANRNTLLRILEGRTSSHDYLKGQTRDRFIVAALEDAAAKLTAEFGSSDPAKWLRPRPKVEFAHPLGIKVAQIPWTNTSPFTVIAEMGGESYFGVPLGNNGFISLKGKLNALYTAFLERFRKFIYTRS